MERNQYTNNPWEIVVGVGLGPASCLDEARVGSQSGMARLGEAVVKIETWR